MTQLKVLQAARLKGRVSAADLLAQVDEDPAEVAKTIAALTESGLLVEGKTLRLSPDGRIRLAELLAQERDGIDADALALAYNAFRAVNVDFKALVTDWQLRDGQPNTHDDPDYDAAVLARLDSVHDRVTAIIAESAEQIPRLSGYSDKLRHALSEVRAGDTTWLTRPIIDSYHTVWFELHEELILAAGLTREDEAKAGHAQ
jgi:hypothetical protein